jgi:probable rRNA maturation factor
MNDPGPSSIDLSIEVAIESPLWAAFGTAASLAEAAISATLRLADADLSGAVDVSLLFCDDAAIRALNQRWRGQDKPTNVLSFPAAAGPGDVDILGDIAIAFETMQREAASDDKSLAAHFSHLVVHGLLHLLGYDHETDAEAEEMEGLERDVLASLGIDDPYRLTLPEKSQGSLRASPCAHVESDRSQ